jgi:hypothetical protein
MDVEKKNNIIKILCVLFFGIVLGFSFAPIKKGIHIEIKNNGNGNGGVSENKSAD